jgi:rhodanese-related sulfurtransferase
MEVLPKGEYDWAHPAGAVHLWLRDIDPEALKRLDTSRPVIVYCNDFL